MKTKHWGWLFDKMVMYLTPEERKALAAGIRKERWNYFCLGVLAAAGIAASYWLVFK